MKELVQVLEDFKSLGMYGVSISYGEGVGCDDSGILPEERSVRLIGYPVGVLGEVKIMFDGKLCDLLDFNLRSKPDRISNPPKREEYKDGGYFIWGTEDSVPRILATPFFGYWEE